MRFSWKIDSFDSKIFGFKVVKITEITSPDDVKVLVKELINNEIKQATFRIQSNSYSIIQALQKFGFVLVDGLISLDIDIQNHKEELGFKQIREAKNTDLGSLKELTTGLYLSSRIYSDSLISKNKADKFFTEWVKNSILGKVADSVLVWDEEGKILGYITLQKKGQIPLLGVSPKARGMGIASKLIKASFAKFSEWEVKKVTIETQINNIAALRVYQDCGFKTVNSYFTLRWEHD